MLDIDYPTQFSDVIQSTECEIELPIEWSDFFDQRGEAPSFADDQRKHRRMIVRTHGMMWFEECLPSLPRELSGTVIYTKDFSRQGAGFLSPFEVYPEEILRLVLPTFWVRLHVVRCRRITSKCYEVGAELIERSDPSPDAFSYRIA